MPKKLPETQTDNETPSIAPPVSLGDAYAKDDAFMRRVPDSALEAHPNFEDLRDLVEEMNDSHNSPLVASEVALDAIEEVGKQLKLDQLIRERAYLLWEGAGRPEGRSDEFWYQAQFEDLRERAYALWESEGCPEGKADEHWYRVQGR